MVQTWSRDLTQYSPLIGPWSILSLGEFLKFEPVSKADSGTYVCLARNALGSSDEISAVLDVKYPPRNIRTDWLSQLVPKLDMPLVTLRNHGELEMQLQSEPRTSCSPFWAGLQILAGTFFEIHHDDVFFRRLQI